MISYIRSVHRDFDRCACSIERAYVCLWREIEAEEKSGNPTTLFEVFDFDWLGNRFVPRRIFFAILRTVEK